MEIIKSYMVTDHMGTFKLHLMKGGQWRSEIWDRQQERIAFCIVDVSDTTEEIECVIREYLAEETPPG